MRQLNWPLQYFVKLTIQCHYFVLQNESELYFLKGMSEREKMCANYHKIRRQMQTFQFQKIQNCGIYTMSHTGGYIFVSPGYHALFWLYKNVRVIVYVLLMWFTFFWSGKLSSDMYCFQMLMKKKQNYLQFYAVKEQTSYSYYHLNHIIFVFAVGMNSQYSKCLLYVWC